MVVARVITTVVIFNSNWLFLFEAAVVITAEQEFLLGFWHSAFEILAPELALLVASPFIARVEW